MSNHRLMIQVGLHSSGKRIWLDVQYISLLVSALTAILPGLHTMHFTN